jgi:Xaa-Pro aminopeptidase
MLTKQGCQQSIGQLLERLQGECQAVVVADRRHIGYLSGFFTNPAAINVSAQSFLVVEPDGSTTLLTDNWQADAARAAHANAIEVFEWCAEEGKALERYRQAAQTLLQILRKARRLPRAIGIERNGLMAAAADGIQEAFPGIAFRDVWDDLVELRQCKLDDEVACLRRALRAREASYSAVSRDLQPGMTELDAYSLAYRVALGEAGEPIYAVGDFLSGVERTAAGAGPPTRRVVQPGDLFIMDVFVLLGGYRSDLCNTFVVEGSATDEQHRRFSVLEAALTARPTVMYSNGAGKDDSDGCAAAQSWRRDVSKTSERQEAYRAAVHRTSAWLASALLPDGSYGPEAGALGDLETAAICLQLTGYPEQAARLLRHIRQTLFWVDGSFSQPTDEATLIEWHNAPSWAAVSAHVNGFFDMSGPAMAAILRFQETKTGGLFGHAQSQRADESVIVPSRKQQTLGWTVDISNQFCIWLARVLQVM